MTDIKNNFYWTDELAEKFAKEYRFSSSRISVEMFKRDNQEKDIPKDWEIISYDTETGLTYNKKANGLFYINSEIGGHSEPYLLEYYKNIKPHSVKRLMDETVFQVGDVVIPQYFDESFKIKSFKVEGNKLYIFFTDPPASYEGGHADINFLRKVKPKVPLFTTDTGFQIFKGEVYFTVFFEKIINDSIKLWEINPSILYAPMYNGEWSKSCKYFATKEEAENWVLLNKP